MTASDSTSRREVLAAGAGLVVAAGVADSARAVGPSGGPSAVVELRQYTLHPGQRDVLIDLFEREFVETQEAVGMTLIGQFRDLDRPDRFVWLRGFPDMEHRAASLSDFYGGPVWKARREAANATIIDSDNVLLLRPADPLGALAGEGARAPVGATASPPGLVLVSIHNFDRPVGQTDVAAWRRDVGPRIAAAGGDLRGLLITESAANTFPRLPVREGENVLVAITAFADSADLGALASLSPPGAVRSELLRLAPTPRSRMHA